MLWKHLLFTYIHRLYVCIYCQPKHYFIQGALGLLHLTVGLIFPHYLSILHEYHWDGTLMR